MSIGIVGAAYVAAAVLFILSLGGLSGQESAKRAVWYGIAGMALAVAGISFVINTLEGSWLTPWLSGRASRINGVVVFAGILFWSWLWGGWGLILGLPIMMVIKAVCDQVEDLKPVGEFMGK